MIWILTQHSTDLLVQHTGYMQEYEIRKLSNELHNLGLSFRIVKFSDITFIVDNGKYRYFIKEKETELPKLAINRIGASINQLATYILETLDLNGVKCINSFETNSLITDKIRTLNLLTSKGIPVPKSFIISNFPQLKTIEENFRFPLVIKPSKGSLGRGVYLCKSSKDLLDVYELILSVSSSLKTFILLQEYLDHSVAQDLRVLIVDKIPYGVMKRTGPPGDFRANITGGGTGEFYPLTDEIKELCSKVADACNLEIGAIDLLFDHDGFKVCEVNTNPGFEGFDKYCKENVAKRIAEYAFLQYNK